LGFEITVITQKLQLGLEDFRSTYLLLVSVLDMSLVFIKCKRQRSSICIVHCREHVSNALFVTNQSCQPHGHRVQPADTGQRSGRLGSPSQLY